MKYQCPVCGYANLNEAPKDHAICPCCGTEFGYDDLTRSWEQILQTWLENGASWFSDHVRPPSDWSAYEQLQRAGVRLAWIEQRSSTTSNTVYFVETNNFTELDVAA